MNVKNPIQCDHALAISHKGLFGEIMAHLIENNTQTGKAEIAYANSKPWHGLGQQLTQDAPIDVWRKEAGPKACCALTNAVARFFMCYFLQKFLLFYRIRLFHIHCQNYL